MRRGVKLSPLRTVKWADLKIIEELLRWSKKDRRVYLATKMIHRKQWFLNARRKKKVIRVVPNLTSCSKRVFKLDQEAPHAKQYARGLPEIFNLETLAELTKEDKTLNKLIHAVRSNNFEEFRAAGKGMGQFFYLA